MRPLLLHLLDLRDREKADSTAIARAMLIVESFLVRRLLVGRATAGLNRVLLSAVTELDQTVPVEQAVHDYFSSGRKHYVTDDDLRAHLAAAPFYLNGRPQQRALILRWLEEAHESKEPVDPSKLSIERVMPQTPTAEWLAQIAGDLDPQDEEVAQIYQGLLHTIGNLTLSGYNAKLSNSPFATKRTQLAKSGLTMNQAIAAHDKWSREEIIARSHALAELAASIWPAPTATAPGGEPASAQWTLMEEALTSIPAGRWTTYGDLAAVVGVIARQVGVRLATVPASNPHRVLRWDGTVSPDFAWLDRTRTEAPRALLEAEGVVFDAKGRAAGDQRLDAVALAALVAPPEADG